MGGEKFTLTAKDYILQIEVGIIYAEMIKILKLLSFSMQDNLCLSGFMSITTSHGSSQWIIGDTFIRTRVTVFDMDNRRIGLAPIPK